MKRESIPAEIALTEGQKLPYALIHSLSGVTLGRTPERVEKTELLEARFFDASQEIRVFVRDGRLCGARLTHAEGDKELMQTKKLIGGKFSGSVTLCRVLGADEDGQTYFAATRLAGWTDGKGERENG